MAFRLIASYYDHPGIFWMCAFSTYYGIYFDNWLLGRQHQMWVINGAAGLFESRVLLNTLRQIVPNFETGDLQITVELMKQKRQILFYPEITALSYVPESLSDFFKQRRRWERGTTKVLWKERVFYLSTFIPPKFLAFALILHMATYIGIFITLLIYSFKKFVFIEFVPVLFMAYAAWFFYDLIKGVWVAKRPGSSAFLFYCLCVIINGPMWILVTMPARIVGITEAVCFLFKESLCSLWNGAFGSGPTNNKKENKT